MLSQLRKRIRPANLNPSAEEILLRVRALFGAEPAKDLRPAIAEKIEHLRHYDLPAMDRALAILTWGRAGSLLLASYFDGHDDVIVLPELCSQRVYDFFYGYPSLPLRDKLLAYPVLNSFETRFFEGTFAISPAQYYAAVQAIVEHYADWPAEFLESRRAFFLFVHIAYNIAIGRQPASSRPLIVYAQHDWDDSVARCLVEDFPQAKFVHTIRDPISSCNGMFRYLLGRIDEDLPRTYIRAPYSALECLTDNDRPLVGMESRTRTVRFEDLHRDPAEVMRTLADWLDLSYQPTLLDSTFNGIPYVVSRDGASWSGPRVEQAQRHSSGLSPMDRALLFALLYENFTAWNYSCPKIFRHQVVRWVVFVSLVLLPTKMEIIAARALLTRRTLPSLRRGRIAAAVASLLGIGFCRLTIIGLLVPAFLRRCLYGATLLPVDHKKQPLEHRDDGARAVRNET